MAASSLLHIHLPAAAAAAQMLVSYMQLLGLLRLIRLDWSEWLRAVFSTFTYLDFTSGVSTWVSIECSFEDYGLLPKSLKRSLVLLLWPGESSQSGMVSL